MLDLEPSKTLPASPFWNVSGDDQLKQLHSSQQGLTGDEASRRLAAGGGSRSGGPQRATPFVLLLAQFKSPIILILLFAVGLSFFLHDNTNAVIILAIVLMSGLLGFWQEHGAANAVAKLLAIIQVKATVLRDGKPAEVAIAEIVPGISFCCMPEM